jgi:hypothetical protein
MPKNSVGDPDSDPHVSGPPGSGSGSISQRYGSGSFPFFIKVLSRVQRLTFFDKTEHPRPFVDPNEVLRNIYLVFYDISSAFGFKD